MTVIPLRGVDSLGNGMGMCDRSHSRNAARVCGCHTRSIAIVSRINPAPIRKISSDRDAETGLTGSGRGTRPSRIGVELDRASTGAEFMVLFERSIVPPLTCFSSTSA
jgi:hypothetical protein